MAYNSIPTRTSSDANSASDVNALMENDAYLKALIDGKAQWNFINTYSITADYAILDTDGYQVIFVNPASRAITVTLPTLADNLGRVITIKVITAGGAVTLDGEGAETIDGATTFVMQSSGDHCAVIGETTGWRILSACSKLDTGWINTADWSAHDIGNSQLTYDTLTGTFTVGEVITEYTDAGRTTPSGVSGIMISDTGSVCVMKNMAGIGVWTNNYYLKGMTSNAVALVNVSTKNVDSNITHNLGKNITNLTIKAFCSFGTTGSDATGKRLLDNGADYGNDYGSGPTGINTNSLLYSTFTSGATCYTDAGAIATLTTEDYSYKIIVERVI